MTETRWLTNTSPALNWPDAKVIAQFRTVPWPHSPDSIYEVPLAQPVRLQFWQAGWFQLLLLSLCAVAAGGCVWLLGKLAIQRQAQRMVQRERTRIARDIHDDLSAGLAQLVLMGEVAQRALPSGSEPRQQVGKVCEKARGLARSMNEILWVVNSQRDTFDDFAAYVSKYAETYLQSTPIRGRFYLDDEMPDIPCDLGMRRNSLLAVKESLHNAVRHSEVSELELRICCLADSMVVTIEDNGKGFDPARADPQRNGLSNMRTRVAEPGAFAG